MVHGSKLTYPRFVYPFKSFDGSGWFDEQVTGDRMFNFN
jgi:hypothetical protein